MVARVNTVAFQGVEVLDIDVQVQLSNGLPAFNIVGLPDKAVGESRERVRAALHAIGLSLPPKRLTVNMSPADVVKEGTHFDLPIALGVLAAMGVIPADELDHYVVLGELALDGNLTRVSGVLPAAIHAVSLGKGIICPAPCGKEALWAGDVDVLAPHNLVALMNHIKGVQLLAKPDVPEFENLDGLLPDLSEVKGQESAKRALEVAAAGGHNMLMVGPPGSGKSMLAARLPGILPPLEPSEALEVSMIHSIAGQLEDGRLIRRRPFRDPHHSASLPSLIGGGMKATPGEISLAHRGVLFLDELPEFARNTLESLRQPLETGRVLVSRVNYHMTFPARFQLIAAMNPCRCGHMADASQACARAPKCGSEYQTKISGPLLDRIDIMIDVPQVLALDLSLPPPSEGSADVAARVLRAREIQRERFKGLNISINAEAEGEMLDRMSHPDDAGRKLLVEAAEKMKLSARGYHRVLRVARTLADLEGVESVRKPHIAEALSYRRFRADRKIAA